MAALLATGLALVLAFGLRLPVPAAADGHPAAVFGRRQYAALALRTRPLRLRAGERVAVGVRVGAGQQPNIKRTSSQ